MKSKLRSPNRAGVRPFGALVRFAAAVVLGCATSGVYAETWTQAVGMELVEPLATWQGGMVRVKLDTPLVTTSCGTTAVVDFVFSHGTQETRSAVIAALYMAFASDRKVRLYVVDGACSPVGAPMFTGLDVLR